MLSRRLTLRHLGQRICSTLTSIVLASNMVKDILFLWLAGPRENTHLLPNADYFPNLQHVWLHPDILAAYADDEEYTQAAVQLFANDKMWVHIVA